MMFNTFIAKKLALVVTLIGTTAGLAPIAVAQSVDLIDKDPYQSNEASPNGEMGDFMNPLGLMHRANLQRSRNGSQFAEDTEDSLSEAAQSFREIQRQRLEGDSFGTSSETNIEN